MADERRRTPRFPFAGTAEILAHGASGTSPAKVTELSLFGCYVETVHTLEKGAHAVLKIYTEGRYFESQGMVLYVQPGQGMGVGFQNVKPHYLTVLKMWLIEAARSKFGKPD